MAQKLVQGGIKAVKNGETELARKAFTQALKLDPNNEAAWLGMATITEAPKDKARILKKVLEINPANDRAQEALRRLEPAAPIIPPVPANPFLEAMDEEMPVIEEEVDLEDIPLPPLSVATGDGTSSSTGTLRSLKASEELAIPEPEPIEEEPPLVLKTAAEAFAQAPAPPATGQGGIPLVNAGKVRELSETALSDVQSYLEESLADYLSPEQPWTKKRRGRAGESEYSVFLGQVSLGIVAFLIVAGLGAYVFIMNSPAAQKILFAPTHTPTNTPTTIPSITPGVTNTPSPTPPVQPSASPTLPITITPGNADQFFPPTATEQYYSSTVNRELLQAVDLMLRGEMDTARELLDDEIALVELSGDFPPYYRLSQWYLLNGDSTAAREILTEWETKWQADNPSLVARSLSLLLIAYARVDVYEAQNGLGDRASLLSNAEERLDSVIGITNPNETLDAVNADAYILLAEVYELRGEIDEAMDILDRGMNATFQDRSLVADTTLRFEKGRILGDAGRYDEALQELDLLLKIDPFNESALLLQIDLALESAQPGLAVLAAQEYLLYYPGSVQGFYLLGQAREAENKLDLALNAYSRAVAGDPADENYTSDPFYLESLLRRAELYTQQGRLDLAADDYRLALEVSDDDELIRVRSLETNFESANYEAVLEVAAELLESGDAPESTVLFYQGRAYVQLGTEDETNYVLGLEALNRAVALGLPQRDIAEAQEYLARANFAVGETEDALSAINAAIDSEDTSSRRFLRGQIYEAQATRTGRNADFEAALLDFEYVLSWGQIFPYPFLAEAQASYDAILERLGER
jgi:tetratricopeptide (TPR) repeat protein